MKQMIVKSLIAVIALLALPMRTFAAAGAPGWLEETMFASGKINTVVMVVAAVLLGWSGSSPPCRVRRSPAPAGRTTAP